VTDPLTFSGESNANNGNEAAEATVTEQPMTRVVKLARTLVELADTLVLNFDVVELLTELTDRCVDVLGGSAAGLMLLTPAGDLRVMASSSEAMHVLELFELQSQEGPCLDCFRSGATVVNDDLESSSRWPRFGAEALAAGFHSVYALPMRLRGTVIGALNLFFVDPTAMRQFEIDSAQALADVATIAILQYRATLEAQFLNDQLHMALNNRIVIEQAKGMLAEHQHIDMDHAFNTLRQYAQNHHRRLGEVAGAVINGSLPLSSLKSPFASERGHDLPHQDNT
jgi:GAF domain-containing protein